MGLRPANGNETKVRQAVPPVLNAPAKRSVAVLFEGSNDISIGQSEASYQGQAIRWPFAFPRSAPCPQFLMNELRGLVNYIAGYQRCQCPYASTSSAINAFVVPCATTALPMRPRRIITTP